MTESETRHLYSIDMYTGQSWSLYKLVEEALITEYHVTSTLVEWTLWLTGAHIH